MHVVESGSGIESRSESEGEDDTDPGIGFADGSLPFYLLLLLAAWDKHKFK